MNRSILVALMVIVLSGVVLGGVTSALFADSETSSNNRLATGEFNNPDPQEEPIPNRRTEDNSSENLKAISSVSFCVDGEEQSTAETGEQTPSEPCLEDQGQLVKFEWSGNSFEPEDDAMNISLNATGFKENDTSEPIEAEWSSSETSINSTVVKSGGEFCEYSGELNGTVESCTN